MRLSLVLILWLEAKRHHHRVTLVHDKNDTVISVSSSRRFAEDHRCELIETKNKGHYKNLVSKQLVREIQHKIF